MTASGVADEIAQHMRRNGMDVLTMRWPEFYSLCERHRMKGGFLEALRTQLAQSSILFVQGIAVVAFVKDFDFAPKK